MSQIIAPPAGALTLPAKQYGTMPTQAQLQTDMNADATANVRRRYMLPAGTISITSDLTFGIGQALEGQGSDANGHGTVIALGSAGRLLLNDYSTLVSCLIQINAGATVDAVYAVGNTSGNGANQPTLRDLQFTGGGGGVWAIHLTNAYEWRMDRIKAKIACNGVTIDTSADHPFNPGDCVAVDVRVRLTAASTTAYSVSGQTSGAILTRCPNDIRWLGCYATGGDQAGWASNSLIGISITNCSRQYFYGMNLEELQTGATVSGQVGGGQQTSVIQFHGGWIRENLVVGSGVLDVQLYGTEIGAVPSGAGAGVVQHLGMNTAQSGTDVYVQSPHIRGAQGAGTLSAELPATNNSGADINANRLVKWTGAGTIAAMTAADSLAVFAGITPAFIANGASGFITVVGAMPVLCASSAAVGDYLVADSATAGRAATIGAYPLATQPVLGVALTSGTSPVVKLLGLPRLGDGNENPELHAYKAWSIAVGVAVNAYNLTSGVPLVVKVPILHSFSCTTITFGISTAGTSLTANQNYVGLYDSTGTQLFASATGAMDTTFASTGMKSVSTGGVALTGGTFVWVALLATSTGTIPALFGNGSGSSGMSNAGLTAATSRVGSIAAQTTLPASFTPSSITQTSRIFWAALS